MKLNHDIYKEAMENVRISDETGRELLKLAAQKNALQKKRFRTQMAAAIAAILAISLGVNGICYAQTGKNVWEMFTSLYENMGVTSDSETFSAIAEGAKKSGESITCNNLKFTLEYYFYDRKNGEVYCALRTDSLDGTPLDMEQVKQRYRANVREGASGTGNGDAPIYNEAQTSAMVYYHYMVNAEDINGYPQKLHFYIVHVMGDDSQEWVTGATYKTEDLGNIVMTPTGQLKARYADCSSLEYCDAKARITSGGLVLYFNEEIWDDEAFGTDAFFPFFEIIMEDGVTYRVGSLTACKFQKTPLYDAEGNLLNREDFTPEVAKLVEEFQQLPSRAEQELPENVYNIAAGYYGSGGNAPERYCAYSAIFCKYFIDVDDIAEVHVNGVKVPLE